MGECFYDFMSPHQRNGRQCQWASGKFHPCYVPPGITRTVSSKCVCWKRYTFWSWLSTVSNLNPFSKLKFKIMLFVKLDICLWNSDAHGSKVKLEWGCPNGTKYPPWQPIQTPQVMCLKPFYLTAQFYLTARVYRQTDGQTDRVIPVYPPQTSLRGV